VVVVVELSLFRGNRKMGVYCIYMDMGFRLCVAVICKYKEYLYRTWLYVSLSPLLNEITVKEHQHSQTSNVAYELIIDKSSIARDQYSRFSVIMYM